MKALLSYSRAKFLSLSAAGRIRALDKLFAALIDAQQDHFRIFQIKEQLAACLDWMGTDAPDALRKINAALQNADAPRSILDCVALWQHASRISARDYQLPILAGDRVRAADPALLARSRQVIGILDNLRSAFNVGSIFRTAECLRLKELWLCGITATPEQPALLKTAMGTAERVAWRYFEQTREALAEARSAGYTLAALETAEGASSVFAAPLPLPLALLLGNESLGLAPEILAACDRVLCLPVLGWKNSLNVAAAFTVCAYQAVCGVQG